jgi:hypothetical protein
MRIIIGFLILGLFPMWVWSCNSGGNGDAGLDVTEEPVTDICLAFSEPGNACPHASTVVCFPVCDAGGGCQCKGNPPIWECTTPPECIDPCGNTSPLNDADCPDVSEGGEPDASDAGEDASDAFADVMPDSAEASADTSTD